MTFKAVSDYALELAQNAHEADASVIRLEYLETETGIRVRVVDNGRGVPRGKRARLLDPAYGDMDKHLGRKEHLGLLMLDKFTRDCGGRWGMRRRLGRGTVCWFYVPRNRLGETADGGVAALFLAALTMPGEYELCLRRRRWVGSVNRGYAARRSKLRSVLGDLNAAESINLLRKYLLSLEEGVLGKE